MYTAVVANSFSPDLYFNGGFNAFIIDITAASRRRLTVYGHPGGDRLIDSHIWFSGPAVDITIARRVCKRLVELKHRDCWIHRSD